MKKNLLALVAVLLLVAVAARLGKDPEGAALEADLRVSLERLWGTHNHQVNLAEQALHVKIDLPKEGLSEWGDPFVRFVAARHPKVEVKEFDISPSQPGQVAPRFELLQRQTQAVVDGALGSGHGLSLMFGYEEVPQRGPQQSLSNQPMKITARQAAPDDGPGSGAPALESDSAIRQAPYLPSTPKVSEECLVVGPEPSDQQLEKLQAQIQAQTNCQRFRIVRLPAL